MEQKARGEQVRDLLEKSEKLLADFNATPCKDGRHAIQARRIRARLNTLKMSDDMVIFLLGVISGCTAGFFLSLIYLAVSTWKGRNSDDHIMPPLQDDPEYDDYWGV